jgi:GLPGLI family protein
MQYIIMCFTLFLNLICNAQVKNGSVEYGYISNWDIKPGSSDYMEVAVSKLKSNQDKVSFSLNFNTSESYFSVNPVLLKDYSSVDDFCFNAVIKSRFYTKPSTEEYRYYENDDMIGEHVMNYMQESKWTITKEIKIIGSYLCYKATSPHFNEDGWNDNPKFTVTAWYTPKIPVSYGPNGYNGLPGLILELQNNISTFYIKKINLNLNPEPQIKDLKDIRVLSIYQKDKLIKASLSAVQAKWMEEQQAIIAKKKAEQEKANTIVAPKK